MHIFLTLMHSARQVMVDDKSSVAAFANFAIDDATKGDAKAAPPASEPAKPKQQEASKPAAAAPKPAAAPAPVPVPQAPAKPAQQQPPAQQPKQQQAQKSTQPRAVWGTGIKSSPLIARLAAQQPAYVENYDSTGLQP